MQIKNHLSLRLKLFVLLLPILGLLTLCYQVRANELILEPIQACIIPREQVLTTDIRRQIAQCLGWEYQVGLSLCQGGYSTVTLPQISNPDELQIQAKDVSFYQEGQSTLSGGLSLSQKDRQLNAQTALIYRNAKTKKIEEIELFGPVQYLEPGRVMLARKVRAKPEDKSGLAWDVVYRFNQDDEFLPAWGRAKSVERFANKDYLLQKSTYSRCSPSDEAWHLEADSIFLDDAKAYGKAKKAKLYLGKVPILYSPYLSFPTKKERRSGFLLPTLGSSSAGGVDIAWPYYWNIAPNYDATITPHAYMRRGLMLGGLFRYLTPSSIGQINANFLPDDKVYERFIAQNQGTYPYLIGSGPNRWQLQVEDQSQLSPDLSFRLNYQQVSDDYYFQDFSTNMAILTERQLVREGELRYVKNNWLFQGLVQSYQTLHPINESFISDIYQRMPQLLALGVYDDLPFNSRLKLMGEFDNFRWPGFLIPMPEGPRYYFSPTWSSSLLKPWGYVTPSVELTQRYYEVTNRGFRSSYQESIPRFSLDGGLFFERELSWKHYGFTQTLEPRLYYLNVPYANQTSIPVYDSAYMIFNYDQLFRNNRFSGLDRIGDANQLAYALGSRWLDETSGKERVSAFIGQIKYFSNRQVFLCQSVSGSCVDNPLSLGYLSPVSEYSPIASRLSYHFNPRWSLMGDYVYDVYTHKTNNSQATIYYQKQVNQLFSLGYTYLASGDTTVLAKNQTQPDALNQISASFAWPLNDRWSSLGAYSYNLSKNYAMMSLFGVQYDSCCWALRLIGGRSFKSLSYNSRPEYNNNIYLELQLKGLASIASSNPTSAIATFIPGFVDTFRG